MVRKANDCFYFLTKQPSFQLVKSLLSPENNLNKVKVKTLEEIKREKIQREIALDNSASTTTVGKCALSVEWRFGYFHVYF